MSYDPPLTWCICCSDSSLTVFWGHVIVFTSFSPHRRSLLPSLHLVLTTPPAKKRQSRPGERVQRAGIWKACPTVRACGEPAASKTWSPNSLVRIMTLLPDPHRALLREQDESLSSLQSPSPIPPHRAVSDKMRVQFPVSLWHRLSWTPVRKGLIQHR